MRLLRASLAALLVGMIIAPAAVLAQGPLELTTPFPSIVADPGATAKFVVGVDTDTPGRVDLTVVSQPTGWTTRLRGGGSTIAAVFTTTTTDVPPRIHAEFTAEVAVPADVTPGTNQVVIEGRTAAGITSRLTLDIAVEQQSAGAVTLSADFPSLRGSTAASFRFNLSLHNGTNQQVTFGLETDAPAGWTVDARPSGSDQAASAVVDAGGDTSIAVTAKAPVDEVAGPYNIVVRAVGGPVPVEAPLQVEITGSFAMALDTSDSRLNARATAGSATVLTLVVTNNGSAPLTNVALSATPPRNWKVDFSPATIPAIAPGASENVSVSITAANDALAGDYVLTMTARNGDANSKVDIRTTVETSPIGYVIGIAILILVAVGLFFVFQRYGRR